MVYTDQQSRDKEKQMNKKNNTKFFFLIHKLKTKSKGTYAQLLIATSEWLDYGNLKIFFLLFT